MLEVKHPARDFNGINQDGESVSLSQFQDEKNPALYFYPKDDTPGCTIAANEFSDLIDQFTTTDTVVSVFAFGPVRHFDKNTVESARFTPRLDADADCLPIGSDGSNMTWVMQSL
ncbi:MAG: redoxin domain-containing protein [Actinomycetia bacterium]|nr:redoxin domain-containing protein [Actinomycetes bacterium]